MMQTASNHVQRQTALDGLGPTARAVYHAIVDYKRTHDGCAPSVRELVTLTGIRSTSNVNLYVGQLVKAGLIVSTGKGNSRGLQVVGGYWTLT